MKVSYRWLNEYVQMPWTAEELAEKLTMAGLEVEEVTTVGQDLPGVVVGQIEEMARHPQAELYVCQVNVGGQKLQLVSGAPNLRTGMKLPVALPGTVLSGNIEISPVDFQGIVSEGMVCSEAELGIGDDASGVMDLPPDLTVGQSLAAALGLDDQVLDIAIYANRPDCMSVLGIAREVAALLKLPLNYPDVSVIEENTAIDSLTAVSVEDKEKCPRYSARVIRQLRIGPSPAWMQQKLRAAGVRPINNVVDITNFVMLETGQPLHAFDYDSLEEHRIVVRTARPGEQIRTLDGEQHTLDGEMLMICDAQSPVCVAGVMGGEYSEVKPETKAVLLESAHFAAQNIRRTSRRLGLVSEAAARFEKGIDPQGTIYALNRAAQLMQEYAGGQVARGIIDCNYTDSGKRVVPLRVKRVAKLLGVEIPSDEIREILQGLEFSVNTSTEPWMIDVPSFRGDIELEEDLIEEVARLWGYDRIPVELPHASGTGGGQSPEARFADSVRDLMVAAGLQETINYSFVAADAVTRLNPPENDPLLRMIPIQNPLSEEYAVMRTSLLPGLLECVSRNLSRQQQRTLLYEIGTVFLTDSLPLTEQPTEEKRLGLVLSGARRPRHWGDKPQPVDFFDLKGIIEQVLDLVDADCTWQPGSHPGLHPGRQAVVRLGSETIAVLGEVHPKVRREFRLSQRVYAAEINLTKLGKLKAPEIRFQPLNRYPAVERDLALILDKGILVADVLKALRVVGGELLKEAEVFDVYEGQPVPDGKKSVAFSFVFQADRNLTDEEVNHLMDQMLAEARHKFHAQIR